MRHKLIYQCMQKIRDLVNDGIGKWDFTKKHNLWNKFCCAMDVIEDADMAIEAYCRGRDIKDYGKKYLRLYGLLQAMFIQQNALDEMCSVLGVKKISKANSVLKIVRDYRNDSIGHPNRNAGASNFIIRVSLYKWSFELNAFDKNNRFSNRRIQLKDLVKKQRGVVVSILKHIYAHLDKSLGNTVSK